MKNEIEKIKQYLDSVGEKISNPNLIIFDHKVLTLLLLSTALFLLLIVFKINYSSISQWDNFIPEDGGKKSAPLLGKSRMIRSDEWLVQTPFMLSQTNQSPKFPSANESLGAGKTPLLMSLPVNHFSAFFRPQNWGFFIFDIERGYAFFWNFKVFGLFLSFFFLLLLLTKNDFWLSLSGSVWLFFSAFIQWWFSTPIPEMIMSFSFIFISLAYLFFSAKKTVVLLAAVSLIVFGMNLALTIYPPFQIPLAYLLLFLFFGYFIQNFNRETLKKILSFKIIILISAIILSAEFLYLFFIDAQETINAIQHTVYPGSRVVSGGELGIDKLFSGFYDIFLREGKFPAAFGNICEASSFLLFFPILIFAFLKNCLKNKKIAIIQLALLSYIIVLYIWMLFGFSENLAKFTLFNMVPPKRALMGIGIASIIWTIIFLSENETKVSEKVTGYALRFKKAFSCCHPIFFLLLLYGLFLNKLANNFFSGWQILFVSLYITALSYLLLNKKKFLFFILLLPYVILPNFPVNPVVQGLGAVYDKKITLYAEDIHEKNKNSTWLVFGNYTAANLLKASGINALNGVKYIPDLEMYKKLDPNSEYLSFYNRYAHIDFQPIQDKNKISFVLDSPDKYTVLVNPCFEKLQSLKIDYVVFFGDINSYNLDCLHSIKYTPVSGAYILKYND